MRRIGVVTGARSDYGIYLPLLHAIQADPELELLLYVTGMHLSEEFGLTVKEIETDGFPIHERIPMLSDADNPEGIAESMGRGTIGFAQAFANAQPDILVVLGDRFEMHAAVVATIPFKIPVAHINGGEVTQGAIDEAFRHSITKLSHLHFVSANEYAKRVIQLGEEPWRVHMSGSLSIDIIAKTSLLSFEELKALHKLRVTKPFLLVTYHPVTLEYEQTEWQVRELLNALDSICLPVLFTLPNADTSGRRIIIMIKEFISNHPSSQLIDNLGTISYFSAMKHASSMVGNSSSGIVESTPFKLPVVNIGTRQKGRIRSRNVIDVSNDRYEILGGIEKALSDEFSSGLDSIESPFGDGHAAERIVDILRNVELNDRLLIKRFADLYGYLDN